METEGYYQKNKEKHKEAVKKYNLSNKGQKNILRNKKKRIEKTKEIGKRFVFDEVTKSKIQKSTIYIRTMKLKKFGVSYDEFLKRVKKQNYSCEICEKKFGIKIKNLPVLDHNHKNGKIRGIICSNCNILLGHINDEIKFLDNFKSYLIKYNS